MGKQHDTFQGEPQEMPLPGDVPEIEQPVDPGSPKIPAENPDLMPDEVPVVEKPEESLVDPGNIALN